MTDKYNSFQWEIQIELLESLHRLHLILAYHLLGQPDALKDLTIRFMLDENTAFAIHEEISDFIKLRGIQATLTMLTKRESAVSFNYPKDVSKHLKLKQTRPPKKRNAFQWKIHIKTLEQLNYLYLILAYHLVEDPDSLEELKVGFMVNEETALFIHQEVKSFIVQKQLKANLKIITQGDTPVCFFYPLETMADLPRSFSEAG